MSIISYSKRTDGEEKLTANFKVKEFACKDGSDTVSIDSELVRYLQLARTFFNVPIHITSAFRTASYNAKCGGAKNSYHLTGRACDHHTKKKIDLFEMAKYYEKMGCKGIIVYPNSGFIHIDTRTSKYYAIDYGKGVVEKKTTFKNCNCGCDCC